ncbi:MAG: diguanylate cyclase [Deltaproteobacteria bacterium]
MTILPPLENSKEKARILIADDDQTILELLENLLSGLGYECVLAQNGQEAIQHLQQQRFDVVLTDMIMPHLGGMELLRHIRENYPRTDVIVVTGHPANFTFTSVIKAGAIDFIVKPFNGDELEAKLNRVLRERRIINQLELLSMKDSLTGLFNRRNFDSKIWEETQRAYRQGYQIFLALIDIDNFKIFNDTHGHQAGDALLRTIGEIMEQSVRKNVDWAFRYGGDEFAIILPQTTVQQAIEIGSRLIDRFSQLHSDNLSLSIGLAKFIRNEQHSFENDMADLIGRADKALYSAKKKGRGQLVLAEES